MDRKREKGEGRSASTLHCFMKKEYNSLIDVETFDKFATTFALSLKFVL